MLVRYSPHNLMVHLSYLITQEQVLIQLLNCSSINLKVNDTCDTLSVTWWMSYPLQLGSSTRCIAHISLNHEPKLTLNRGPGLACKSIIPWACINIVLAYTSIIYYFVHIQFSNSKFAALNLNLEYTVQTSSNRSL